MRISRFIRLCFVVDTHAIYSVRLAKSGEGGGTCMWRWVVDSSELNRTDSRD